MGVVTQQHPNRFAHCSRKMRYRAIGHDHQVKVRYCCGSVGKIGKLWVEIGNWSAARQRRQFACRRALLQTVKLYPRQGASLEETQQALRSPMIFPKRYAAGPDDADLELAIPLGNESCEFI
jgi:hypothetical protein